MLATFEIFHVELNNDLRDQSYQHILDTMSHIERLGSPTVYLNTKEKVDQFLADNPKFKINTVEDYAQPGETFPPSSGVIGVWASNYLAYKNFLETDKELLFIFEDDVLLSANFKSIVSFYLKELPNDWDFFSLFVPDDSLFAYNTSHDIGKANVCKSYQQWSCAGYVVSKAGARKAVQDIESRGITAPVDWYVFNFRMKPEEDQMMFNTYTLRPEAYKPVKFLLNAAVNSQIHRGKTELLHTAK
jgi:GR25 family glycosyltransferase involved in LPS biosynthesis